MVQFFMKRTLDVCLVLSFLPVAILLILFLAMLVKLESSGPIFHIQYRMGRNRKLFPCLKFRTMYINSHAIFEKYLESNPEIKQEWQKYKKIKHNDPRITKVGKILRKTSFDELPQIFNVLFGQMSLVGPRPYLPHEEEKIGESALKAILSVNPGMTGLWQVSGRNNLCFEKRVELDCYYVDHWSLWLDIKIMLKTIYVVITAEGAY